MNIILMVILLFVTLAMIGVILLQRSEGGGLGSSSNAMGGFMSARGTANLLTKTTAILATLFMFLCILLAVLNGRTQITADASIVDQIAQTSSAQPVDVPNK